MVKLKINKFVKKKINDVTYICAKVHGKLPLKTARLLKSELNEVVSSILNPVDTDSE